MEYHPGGVDHVGSRVIPSKRVIGMEILLETGQVAEKVNEPAAVMAIEMGIVELRSKVSLPPSVRIWATVACCW